MKRGGTCVAAFASVYCPIFFPAPFHYSRYFLHMCMGVCACVSQQLTSFLFALLALSHSCDVLKQGEASILLLAGEPGGGNERYSPHFIHQQPHTLTQQPTMSSVLLCVCLFMASECYGYASVDILCLLRITLHGCINCLRSVVISALQWSRVLSEYQGGILQMGTGKSLTCVALRLVQCSSSSPGR